MLVRRVCWWLLIRRRLARLGPERDPANTLQDGPHIKRGGSTSMSLRAWMIALTCLTSLLLTPLVARSGESFPGDEEADRATLRRSRWPQDAPSILQRIRQSRKAIPAPEAIDKLIDQLGDAEFERREEASKALNVLGPAVLAKLSAAAKHKDAEIARRARECTDSIVSRQNPEVIGAAVRIIARSAPEGALDGLLALLPSVADEELQDDIWYALDAVAQRGRAMPQGVAERGTDAIPSVRAASAYLLARRGEVAQRAVARKALSDKDPLVRLRVAQGLLGAKDKAGIPALIAMLEAAPFSIAWQAEELLRYAAGEGGAPDPVVGRENGPGRKKCSAAWQTWWEQEGARLDLRQRDDESRRPLLLLMCSESAPARVWLTGCDGRPRWEFEISKAHHVVEAYLLPGEQVTFVENDKMNTGRYRVGNLDLKRNSVGWVYQAAAEIVSYERLSNGNWLLLEDNKRLIWLDKGGRVLRSEVVTLEEARKHWPPGQVGLRNGNTLLNDTRFYRFFERTQDGKLVWVLPGAVTRHTARPCYPLVGLGFDTPRPKDFDLMSAPTALIALGSKDADVRLVGAISLRASKERPAGAFRTILNSADEAEDEVRRAIGNAAWTFAQPEDFSLVLATATDKRARVRRFAMDLLRKFDAKADEVVPALVKGLKDDDAGVRQTASWSLRTLGPKAEPAIPDLIRLLKDNVRPDSHSIPLATTAADTLTFMPAARAPLLGLYAESAKSQDETFRALVFEAIIRLSIHDKDLSAKFMPEMRAALRGDAGNSARRAVLSGVIPGGFVLPDELVPDLVGVARDKTVEKRQRDAAITQLWRLEGKAKIAIPLLEELAKDADEDIRRQALFALERIRAAP